MPNVLNICRGGVPEGAVYVGRNKQYGDPKWGNPFKITLSRDRDQAIFLYEDWIYHRVRRGQLDPEGLRGRDLACHCAPLRCHAEVLLRLANE